MINRLVAQRMTVAKAFLLTWESRKRENRKQNLRIGNELLEGALLGGKKRLIPTAEKNENYIERTYCLKKRLRYR